MAKRRLNKQQSRRIREKRRVQHGVRNDQASLPDDALGPPIKGLVLARFGKQVEVEDVSGNRQRCYLRANLDDAVTGDFVTWRSGTEMGVVEALSERKSLLSRSDNFGKLKPVAANVDQIFVTIAPEPAFHFNLIDRYLIIAEANSIRPIILVNKCELIGSKLKAEFDALTSLYTSLGYKVIYVSAKQGDGFSQLNPLLGKCTSIFVGQSGVGKSSLLKGLVPADEQIEIGALSEAKSKGRHTTTHSRLFHLPNEGRCIDSPGIREFGLWHLDKEVVSRGFFDVSEAASNCKFRDCSHQNEPGCAIDEALENGTLSRQRFISYQHILASLNEVTMQQDVLEKK